MADMIKVYGATWCPDCRRAKQFFDEHNVQYEWIDITDNEEAIATVEELNEGNRSIPTILFPDGGILVEPSNAELAAKTDGVADEDLSQMYHDVIVIGGGPAGLTTAIYTAREGLQTLVMDKSSMGGQAAITQMLDNFPGFPEGIPGAEFAERLTQQAQRFGVDLVYGDEVVDIMRNGQYLVVKSADGRSYIGRTVLIATGTHYKQLNVPGESELIGRNVHFCATCDGAFYKDKHVVVVGGGNSGFEEGLFLADQFADTVRIVEFMPEVNASQIYQDKVAARDDISVHTNHAIREFLVEEGEFAGILVEDRATGQTGIWETDGVFVFIGLVPNTSFLPRSIELDRWGFIQTDGTLQTSMPGVFAAGDVRVGSTKQAVSAAGEGATAALMMRQYLQTVGNSAPTPTSEQEEMLVQE